MSAIEGNNQEVIGECTKVRKNFGRKITCMLKPDVNHTWRSRIKITLGLGVEHGAFKKVSLRTDTVLWLVGAWRWEGEEEDTVQGVGERLGQGWQKIRLKMQSGYNSTPISCK